MARETSVTANVTREIKEKVRLRAARQGRTESNYVKRLILADLGLLETAEEASAATAAAAESLRRAAQVASESAKDRASRSEPKPARSAQSKKPA